MRGLNARDSPLPRLSTFPPGRKVESFATPLYLCLRSSTLSMIHHSFVVAEMKEWSFDLKTTSQPLQSVAIEISASQAVGAHAVQYADKREKSTILYLSGQNAKALQLLSRARLGLAAFSTRTGIDLSWTAAARRVFRMYWRSVAASESSRPQCAVCARAPTRFRVPQTTIRLRRRFRVYCLMKRNPEPVDRGEKLGRSKISHNLTLIVRQIPNKNRAGKPERGVVRRDTGGGGVGDAVSRTRYNTSRKYSSKVFIFRSLQPSGAQVVPFNPYCSSH